MMKRAWIFLALVAAIGAAGCQKKDGLGPPQPASAATQPRFAERYGDTLRAESEGFDATLQGVLDATPTFPGFADALNDPCDFARAEAIVRAADEAGRSEAYVEKARQRDAVQAFFEENEEARFKRLAGGVQYAVTQAGCKDAGGQAAGTMKRQLGREIDETTREGNEAHALLDRSEEALGKENTGTMRDQADVVAEASYRVHIELPTRKYAFGRHVAAGGEARETLEDEIEVERERAMDPGVSDGSKKAAEARAAALEEAKNRLDAELEAARTRFRTMDDELKEARDAYDQALEALLASLRERAEAAAGAS
ncbi:MAG: hypothetical protein AAGN82_31825 [Myxococcota bacterium]